MTFEDMLTDEQRRRLKRMGQAEARQAADPTARFFAPVEGAVRVTPEQFAAFAGQPQEPRGRGWHRERSQERVK